MHLRYCLRSASDSGINQHPQTDMANLDIKYKIATPQSTFDQWWFWGCDNVPDVLPSYLTILDLDPNDCIGWGLSKEDVRFINT